MLTIHASSYLSAMAESASLSTAVYKLKQVVNDVVSVTSTCRAFESIYQDIVFEVEDACSCMITACERAECNANTSFKAGSWLTDDSCIASFDNALECIYLASNEINRSLDQLLAMQCDLVNDEIMDAKRRFSSVSEEVSLALEDMSVALQRMVAA